MSEDLIVDALLEKPQRDKRPTLSAYDQSWRDKAGAWIAGEDRDPIRHKIAHLLMRTSGMGRDPTATSAVGLPVLSSAIDAAEQATKGAHGHAALEAALAASDVYALAKVPGLLKNLAFKPPINEGHFSVPFTRASDGRKGFMAGEVEGTKAYIGSAYMGSEANYNARNVNSVGPVEIRRAIREIQSEFPRVSSVSAARVSGARHGKAGSNDSRMSFEFKPLWERNIDKLFKGGID